MKGNHNSSVPHNLIAKIVFNISKIQNERKSQLLSALAKRTEIVFNISKIQNERKSQHKKSTDGFKPDCVQHIKDTK